MPHCITAHHCTMLCPIYPISRLNKPSDRVRSSQIWASQRGRSTLATSLGMTSQRRIWRIWRIWRRSDKSPASKLRKRAVQPTDPTGWSLPLSQKVVYYIILQCTTINHFWVVAVWWFFDAFCSFADKRRTSRCHSPRPPWCNPLAWCSHRPHIPPRRSCDINVRTCFNIQNETSSQILNDIDVIFKLWCNDTTCTCSLKEQKHVFWEWQTPGKICYELLPSCSTMLPFTQEPTELLKTSTALPRLKLGPSKEEHGRTIKTSKNIWIIWTTKICITFAVENCAWFREPVSTSQMSASDPKRWRNWRRKTVRCSLCFLHVDVSALPCFPGREGTSLPRHGEGRNEMRWNAMNSSGLDKLG